MPGGLSRHIAEYLPPRPTHHLLLSNPEQLQERRTRQRDLTSGLTV